MSLYRCTECSFSTFWKFSHQHHRIQHKDVENENCSFPLKIYRCLRCRFQATQQDILKKHGRSEFLTDYRQIKIFNEIYKKIRHNSKLGLDKLEKSSSDKICKKIIHNKSKKTNFDEICKSTGHSIGHNNPGGNKWKKSNVTTRINATPNKSHNVGKHVILGSIKRFTVFATKLSTTERYQCQKCPFSSANQISLNHHVTDVHRKTSQIEQFECQKEPFKSKDLISLNPHMADVHIKTPKIEQSDCPKVSFGTSNQIILNHHMADVYRKTPEIEQSERQKGPFRTQNLISPNYHRAEMNKKQVDTERFDCQICLFKANNQISLDHHVSDVHRKSPEIEWVECQKGLFTSKNLISLNYHEAEMHEIERFECEKCPFTTVITDALRDHIAVVHNPKPAEIRSDATEQCSYQSKTNAQHTPHVKIKKLYTGNVTEQFVCEHCPFSTKCKQTFKEHNLKKHPPPSSAVTIHYCLRCRYATRCKNSMQMHKVVKHDSGFASEFCSFRSYLKSDVKTHDKLYHVEKIGEYQWRGKCPYR